MGKHNEGVSCIDRLPKSQRRKLFKDVTLRVSMFHKHLPATLGSRPDLEKGEVCPTCLVQLLVESAVHLALNTGVGPETLLAITLQGVNRQYGPVGLAKIALMDPAAYGPEADKVH